MDAWEASKNALENVLEAVDGERIIIVCDEERTDIGEAFANGALSIGLRTRLAILQEPKAFRTEIPERLQEILNQKPDIYINLLRGNREETPFRIKLIKTETHDHKARLGHCPGVTLDMLTEGALALTPEEHKSMQGHAERLIHALEDTATVEICNPTGTNLTLSTQKRKFFTDTKLDWKTLKWINLPTGEVIVAPVEDSLNGKLVCDMAIGGIGKLRKPVEVTAKNGRVETVLSRDKDHLRRIEETFATDDWSDVVGEFAFGINPKARFVTEFLEAEKILGTVHVAFGENMDMPGGKNPSKNHMDLLISDPTVKVTKKDGETVTILEKGCFQV
ncbi:MAG: aminopeptidase [Candidatus Bathyarchaeota archaeon]|nr:aminopeptidase [Candidatus Bathyarchaeota archaeon]